MSEVWAQLRSAAFYIELSIYADLINNWEAIYTFTEIALKRNKMQYDLFDIVWDYSELLRLFNKCQYKIK